MATQIKANFLEGKMNKVQAAKALSSHNGNPLMGNLQIVASWRR